VQLFDCLFIYVLTLEVQLSSGGWLGSHHIFVSSQSQDLDFQHHMS